MAGKVWTLIDGKWQRMTPRKWDSQRKVWDLGGGRYWSERQGNFTRTPLADGNWQRTNYNQYGMGSNASQTVLNSQLSRNGRRPHDMVKQGNATLRDGASANVSNYVTVGGQRVQRSPSNRYVRTGNGTIISIEQSSYPGGSDSGWNYSSSSVSP